ncbi:MAG TPA: hypothetical protein VG713_02535 [Pirellulales bacterium]|nr:hypothetical protein [Pirellulales bacterium]
MVLSKKKPAAVATGLMDHQAYADAWHKLNDLQRQSHDLQKQLEDFRLRRDKKRNSLDDAADELLKSGKFPTAPGAMTAEIQTVNEKLAVVNRALELATQELERQRREVSKAICRAARPVYVAIVEKMKGSLLEAAAALAAEDQFRRTLIDGDVDFTGELHPMNFPAGAFDLNEYDSTISRWLREAAEHYPEAK